MKLPLLSRRAVLRGGGAAVALPLLEAMAPRAAHAADGPKRVVFFFMPHGTVRSLWTAAGAGAGMTFGYTLAPLEAVKTRLTVINKLDSTAGAWSAGNPHARGAATILTGRVAVDKEWGAGISIDRHLGKRLAERNQLRFPSLQFGIQTAKANGAGSPSRFLSYDGSKQYLTPVDSPREMFDRLFKDAAAGGDPAAARAQAKRKSVLDFVMDDMKRLAPRLGTADARKLDEHLTAVAAVEKRVSAAAPAATGCSPGTAAPLPAEFEADGKAQAQLVVNALACDLARVAVLQWGAGQTDLVHKFLGVNHSAHWVSHDTTPAGPEQLKIIQKWHVQQYVDFCLALDKVREGTRTLLDNTAVVLISETAEGPSHSFVDMPFLIVGGMGGAIRTGGRVLDYEGRNQNDLWVSLLHAMGFDDKTFGEERFNKGPLPGLLA